MNLELLGIIASQGPYSALAPIDFANKWWSYDGATLPHYGTLVNSSYYDSDQNTTWTILETWHGSGRDLMVEGYVHTGSGSTTARGRPFQSHEFNDDHGISSVIADDDGYLHAIGGAHINDDFKYSISENANDPKKWVEQTSPFTNATYPKLLKKDDGNLILYYRKDLDTLSFFQTTSVGSGSATWGAEVEIWIRAATNSRVYPSYGFLDGEDLWIVCMKSNSGNTLRWDLYILVYDTDTGDLKNHNGTATVSAGSLPINDTTADSDFRVIDWSDSLRGWYPDIYKDSAGAVHIVWLQENVSGTFDIYHAYKATTGTASFSTPEIIANTIYSNAAPTIVEYSSTIMRCWFIEDIDDDFGGAGGNLYYVERSSATWGAKTSFHEPSPSRYGFHRPHRVHFGQNEAKLMVTERTPGSSDSVAGGLKTYLLDSNHQLLERPVVAGTEYTALVAAFAGSYSAGRLLAIDQLFNNLSAWGILAKLDALWLFNAPNESDAVLNWVDPGSYNATYSGTPTFVANEGLSTDGATSYIDLNFNPATAGGNYSQNDASFGFWCLDNNAGSGTAGRLSSGNGVFINSWSGSQMSGRINHSNSVNNMSSATGTAVGLSAIDRDAVNSLVLYKNGEQVDTDNTTSQSLVNGNLILGGTSAATRAQNFAAAWVGGSLSEDQHRIMSILIGSYLFGVTKGTIN